MKIKQNLLLGFFIVFSFESIAEKLSNNLSTQTFTQEEVKDSTIKTPNYKWEVAFGLPKSFDKIERLGQYLILKRPFTNKNGKLRAFRYALNFNVTSFEQELIIGNTKDNETNIGLSFGNENQKFLSKNLYLLNGFNLGTSFTRKKNQDISFDSKFDYFSFNAEYFLGLKFYISKQFSLTTETSVLTSYNPAKYSPNDRIIKQVNTVLYFSPLQRFYFSYNF